MAKLVCTEGPEKRNSTAQLENKKLVPCKFCSKQLSQTYVREHQVNCTKNPLFDNVQPTCGLCGRSFARKRSLILHLKICSVQSSKSRKKIPCMFENCSFEFFFRYALIQHLNEIHKCDIEVVQKRTFNSFQHFLAWKEDEELRTYSYFSKKCGEVLGKTYYYCQHDGSSKPHRKSTEKSRKTGTKHHKGVIKRGGYCIAMMKLTRISNGRFELAYFPGHNHPLDIQDLKHHPQSPATYKFIDKQIALGVPPEKIIEDLKEFFPNDGTEENIQPTKVSYITKKLIRERMRYKFKALQRQVAIEEISDCHNVGMDIPDGCVKCVTVNTSWKVFRYLVSKYQEECSDEQCVLKCKSPECPSLCIHMYECTCKDQNPLCKHIHKVHSVMSRGVISIANASMNKDCLEEKQLDQSLRANLHILNDLIASRTIPHSVGVKLNDYLGQIVDALQPLREFYLQEIEAVEAHHRQDLS